jgi:activator of HSP90 ATPase
MFHRAIFSGLAAAAAVIHSCVLAAATAASAEGLSNSAASIHQEVNFGASCARVYAALTTSGQFDAVTRLSDGATLLAAPGALPTTISARVGGAFALFGGYISGRNLDMVPGTRLVQAWRTKSWDAGAYSIVSFALAGDGANCQLTFEQRGFPQSQGSSLAYGWRVHYWDPLTKFLAQR